MNRKIKSIIVVTNMNNSDIEVGVDSVARIENASLEFEDSIVIRYLIYDKDDNLLRELINCPVDVRYE